MSDVARSEFELARRPEGDRPAPARPSLASPKRWPRRTLRTVGGLLLLAALIGIGIDFYRFARDVTAPKAQEDVKADGIVALTGGNARIDQALSLLASRRADKLLISGVNPSVGRHDIAGAIDSANRPMLDQRVDLGHRARDTIGNADETRDWAKAQGIHSLIVVTSDYHMPRSMAELEKAMPGIELIPYPVPSPSLDPNRWWERGDTVKLLLREYLKYTLARMRLAFEPAR